MGFKQGKQPNADCLHQTRLNNVIVRVEGGKSRGRSDCHFINNRGKPDLFQTGITIHQSPLVLLGRRTRRQFPEQSEQGRCSLLVREILERHGCHEVGRSRVEADADEIFVAP